VQLWRGRGGGGWGCPTQRNVAWAALSLARHGSEAQRSERSVRQGSPERLEGGLEMSFGKRMIALDWHGRLLRDARLLPAPSLEGEATRAVN
jgi:hypothetical protein